MIDVSQQIRSRSKEGSFKEIHSHLYNFTLPLQLVPLTAELATSGYGYKIRNASAPIRNLFCINDLKLYSKN